MYIDPYSTVVGDIDSVSRVAAKLLSPQRELWDILDLSSIIESLAINEKMILFDFNKGEDVATERTPFFELFKGILKEGAIEVQDFPSDNPKSETNNGKHNRLKSKNTNSIDAATNPTAQLMVEANNTALAEQKFSCPGFLLTLQQPIYEGHANVVKDHDICNLSSKYDSLKNTLYEYRNQSQLIHAKFRVLPIPPIANFAFRKCKNINEAVESALYTRKKFSKLRKPLIELRQFLEDETITPKKKYKQIRSWQKSWSTLEKISDDRGIVEIADTNDYLLQGADLFIKASESLADWKKVVLQSVEELQNLFFRWRVRPLHNIGNRYKNTPNSEINKHAERILGIPIRDKEIKDFVEVFDTFNTFKTQMRLVPYEQFEAMKKLVKAKRDKLKSKN
ncbi:MAG: hypothetical protein HOP27_01825 [Anaerolineales bacterium]|nr:hypothetical protein [Anaerolineales bacterium]